MKVRIGQGYDVHRFADEATDEAELSIAGVKIPHTHALLAHSDGDVAIHAFCDAMLGALSLGDIGQHFPDSDPDYAGIDSSRLLLTVNRKVQALGFRLGNADLTLVAQAPRLATHIPAMRQRLAQLLSVPLVDISIKATTTEGLGFAGRREGIACYAHVLLEQVTDQDV